MNTILAADRNGNLLINTGKISTGLLEHLNESLKQHYNQPKTRIARPPEIDGMPEGAWIIYFVNPKEFHSQEPNGAAGSGQQPPLSVINVRSNERDAQAKVVVESENAERTKEAIESLFQVEIDLFPARDGNGGEAVVGRHGRMKEYGDMIGKALESLGEWWEGGEREDEAPAALVKIADALEFRLGSLR